MRSVINAVAAAGYPSLKLIKTAEDFAKVPCFVSLPVSVSALFRHVQVNVKLCTRTHLVFSTSVGLSATPTNPVFPREVSVCPTIIAIYPGVARISPLSASCVESLAESQTERW